MKLKNLPEMQESSYRVLNRLGRGGFGEVFLVESKSGGMKVLKDYDERDDKFVFIGEAIGVRRECKAVLPEDFVVPECGERYEARLRVVMNYINGKSFDDLLYEKRASIGEAILPEFDIPYLGSDEAERRRVLDGVELIKSYVFETAKKLKMLMEAGVAHGDIRPANVLKREDGEGALVDFDFLRRIDLPFLSTEPFYLDYNSSPELIDPYRRRLSATSDMYALGMTSMYSLYGMTFFPKLNSEIRIDVKSNYVRRQLADGLRADKPLTESSFISGRIRRDLVGKLPDYLRWDVHGLVEFGIAALNRDPGARPKSAEEVRQLLEMRPNVGMYYGPASLGK